jgi:hypothetical protein
LLEEKSTRSYAHANANVDVYVDRDDNNNDNDHPTNFPMHQHGPLQNNQLGGGFATTGMVAIVGILAGYMLDSNPYTRRLVPFVQPAVERFQRSYQHQAPQLHQTDVLIYDDPSGHRQIPQFQHEQLTNTLSQALCQCPLSGGSININFPPNTAYAILFLAFSVVLYTLITRFSVVRPRRDLNFLFQLQQQLHNQTTSIPTAARYCQTSEQAIRDWLRHYEAFSNGPAVSGPEHP